MNNRENRRVKRSTTRSAVSKTDIRRGNLIAALIFLIPALLGVGLVWHAKAAAGTTAQAIASAPAYDNTQDASVQDASDTTSDNPATATGDVPAIVQPSTPAPQTSKPRKPETYLELDMSQGKGLFTAWRLEPSNEIALTDKNKFKRVCDLRRGDSIHMSQGLIGLVTKAEKYVDPNPDETDSKPDADGNVAERVIGRSMHVTDTLLYLRTTDELLKTTPEHPFFVHGKGWVKAGALRQGDQIETESADKLVSVVSTEVRHERQAVYNLDVENTHTFYVGNDKLLVHNGDCVPTPDFVVSENGTAVEIPEGYEGRVADNGKGLVYQNPADIGVGNGNQNIVRIADPTPRYPNGYARFYNKYGQPIDASGNPGSQSTTHFPF